MTHASWLADWVPAAWATATGANGPLPGVMLLGLQPRDQQVLGFRLLVDPILVIGTLPSSSTVTLPIPAAMSLAGLRLYAQTVHARGTSLVASKGLRFTLF